MHYESNGKKGLFHIWQHSIIDILSAYSIFTRFKLEVSIEATAQWQEGWLILVAAKSSDRRKILSLHISGSHNSALSARLITHISGTC
jgi:hypothetical protein